MQEKIEGIPDGYKIKRYGKVRYEEFYMHRGQLKQWPESKESSWEYLILEKIKVRRQIVPQDCLKGPVEAILAYENETIVKIVGFTHRFTYNDIVFHDHLGSHHNQKFVFIEE